MTYPNIVVPPAGTELSRSGFGIPVRDAIQDMDVRLSEVESSAWTGAVKLADTTRTSTATVSADPHLSIPVIATGIYRGELTCYWNAANNTNGGARIQMRFPSSSDFIWTQLRISSASVSNNGSDVNVDFGGEVLTAVAQTSEVASLRVTTAVLVVVVDFTMIVGSISGSLQLYWAQSASNAVGSTLKKGSSLTLFRQG
jgi:hypothetical protein